jgi:catechol 2,3-dioxygenase-like lactoylglutathione lyase family enzyme
VVLSSDDETVRFRVMADFQSGLFLGVRQYEGREAVRFDEFHTGLDHLAFGVADRGELESWEQALAQRGIPYTPIVDTPIGSVIVFRDPDNIQLEFWLPAS